VSKPVRISQGFGRIDSLSVSADGKRLTFVRENGQFQVWIAEIDPAMPHFRTPRRLTLDENQNVVTAWTPDSRSVLFTSNRNGVWKIFRQSLDQYVPDVVVEGRNIFGPRLSPDGKYILYGMGYTAEDPTHAVRIMEIPTGGGSPRQILQKASVFNVECARSPSKLCLLDSIVGSADQFEWFNPEKGETREFVTFQHKLRHNWGLSPDGSQLALLLRETDSNITFVNVRDKTLHDVELKQWLYLNGIDWAADGKSVFVTGRNEDLAPVVLSVEPSGNVRVLLEGDKALWYPWVVPSPDGRYGALSVYSSDRNVWMMEDF
jgi:Tol biopolymer transport system component